MMVKEHTHIVAEAGTTHEGDPSIARKLVEVAKAAGADSVKFQFIDPQHLYLPMLRENGALVENPAIAARSAQEFSEADWRAVATHAAETGISFSASVFDIGRLNFLVELGAPYVKIASTDCNNDGLIEAVAATGKTVLLSTGMSSLGEIEHAVEVLHSVGATDVVLFHCVSAYPCPAEIANVGFVETLKTCFGFPVGYSDHTESSLAAVAAVALGATWIEKHFTLDRSAKGFDHAYAMEPQMLVEYVRDVRAAEAALTPAHPKLGEIENDVKQRARRGLWAAQDLPAGHVLTNADILVVRPSGPLTPRDLDRVIGRRLSRCICASAPIRFEDLAPDD